LEHRRQTPEQSEAKQERESEDQCLFCDSISPNLLPSSSSSSRFASSQRIQCNNINPCDIETIWLLALSAPNAIHDYPSLTDLSARKQIDWSRGFWPDLRWESWIQNGKKEIEGTTTEAAARWQHGAQEGGEAEARFE
jgi:hypothetical protein